MKAGGISNLLRNNTPSILMNMDMNMEYHCPILKIFVGYDSREDVAYQVCRHSLLKHASIPVEVIPLKQSELRETGLYTRERGPTESTEFSFTRFLTPYLARYQGWAVFVDCDFLFLADVAELMQLADNRYALMCVKHEYQPKEGTKMDGVLQTSYPRKNWSSMVLYNCQHPNNQILTPQLVSSQSGAFLHRYYYLITYMPIYICINNNALRLCIYIYIYMHAGSCGWRTRRLGQSLSLGISWLGITRWRRMIP